MIEIEFTPRLRTIYRGCLSNAKDLLKAANKILNEENLPNIAYSLAVIALEEIGKAELLLLNHFAQTRDNKSFSKDKYFEDHIRKLFWALWGRHSVEKQSLRNKLTPTKG